MKFSSSAMHCHWGGWGRHSRAFGPAHFNHTWAHHYWHRPPSRLFWFITGAVTAGWFIHGHRHREQTFAHCHRPSISETPFQQPRPPMDNQQTQEQLSQPQKQWHWKRWEFQYPPQAAPPPQQPAPAPAPPVQTSPWDRPWGWGLTHQQQEKLWQEEMERMQTIAKQAGDAMTELSESTLDNVLKTVESLSSRLAAHREAKERQQEQLEKRLDDIKKNPPRLV